MRMDAAVMDALQQTADNNSEAQIDFAKGNVKARTRMVAQYEIAALVAFLARRGNAILRDEIQ